MRLCERPDSIVRSYVLNGLRYGPWEREDLIQQGVELFGFSRAQILAAAKWAAVIESELDGALYWMRPANLYAIWWGIDLLTITIGTGGAEPAPHDAPQ